MLAALVPCLLTTIPERVARRARASVESLWQLQGASIPVWRRDGDFGCSFSFRSSRFSRLLLVLLFFFFVWSFVWMCLRSH